MIFNSYIFLFVFFPIAFIGFWALKNKQARYIWLTVMGYVFYGYWNWKFLILMLATTALDFWAAKKIGRSRNNRARARQYLILSLVANLGALGFFKYANFFAQSAASLAKFMGVGGSIPLLHIILPISISFYTFQAISYTIDVYRGKAEVITNFFEYSTYIALFAHLVAGPIVRYTHIAPDLKNIGKPPRAEFLFQAVNFFVIGLVKKVVIADSIASFVNPLFADYASLGTLGAWLAVVGYTYQLYFDFSGYSDMAVGLAYSLGFRFPQNFNSPYKAINISDFWRRWHISLSAWLKDYLFIPLGGSRRGEGRTYVNLMATMLLGGLWHGANWTFVVWGAYHGALLALYRRFHTHYDRLPLLIQRASTFFLVVIGWVFFRSPTFETAGALLKKMFWLTGDQLPKSGSAISLGTAALLAAAFAIAAFFPNTFEIKYSPKLRYAIILGAAVVFALILMNYKQNVFLYYQF